MSSKIEQNGTKSGKMGRVSRKNATIASPKPTEKMLRYANIRLKSPKTPKIIAAQQAGYSKGTHPATIEQLPAFATLRDRLEAAAAKAGVTPDENLSILSEVMHDKADRKAQVNAVKVANEMLGWNNPTQLQVTHTTAIGVFLGTVRDADISLVDALKEARHDRAV